MKYKIVAFDYSSILDPVTSKLRHPQKLREIITALRKKDIHVVIITNKISTFIYNKFHSTYGSELVADSDILSPEKISREDEQHAIAPADTFIFLLNRMVDQWNQMHAQKISNKNVFFATDLSCDIRIMLSLSKISYESALFNTALGPEILDNIYEHATGEKLLSVSNQTGNMMHRAGKGQGEGAPLIDPDNNSAEDKNCCPDGISCTMF